ncbi:hypothetical protein MAR_035190, partial [Mya arenaria]
THLKNDEILNVEGYTWIGHNRTNLHRRTPKGSGGIGVLIRNTFLNAFTVNKLNDEHEGILWISLTNKITKERLRIETPLSQVKEYQRDSLVSIVGDFNIRVGNNDDYIAGVDCIPERDIIDYHISPYCDAFLDFLLIVDYCLVPYEQLNRYEHFYVIRATYLLQKKSAGINTLDRITIPDHSVLQWTLSMTNFKNVDSINTSVVNGKLNKSKIIHDRQNIPEVFMNKHDMYELLKEKINLLEADRDKQEHIDNSYTEFLDILTSQMKTHLNPREINLNVNNTKNKRVNKLWWNEDLSVEWKGVCVSEKLWLNCKIRSQKNLLKAIFINKIKLFDKNVKRRKGHTGMMNKSDFWKDLGKIGIGSERNKSIPIEVLLADGSIDKAANSLNKNKAPGNDGIPAEMLNNQLTVYYLHALFNGLFLKHGHTDLLPQS